MLRKLKGNVTDAWDLVTILDADLDEVVEELEIDPQDFQELSREVKDGNMYGNVLDIEALFNPPPLHHTHYISDRDDSILYIVTGIESSLNSWLDLDQVKLKKIVRS